MSPADYLTLRRNVQSHEGLRLKPYSDVRGRLTIGWGRNLTDVGINQLEANTLLENDLDRAISDLQRAFPFTMDMDCVRFIVLAEVTFNIGIEALKKFAHMWAAIQAKDWNRAALELLNSEAARETGTRYTMLAEALRSGEFA